MRSKKSTDVCVRFGAALRKRRNQLGISQESVAAAAGLNRMYVGDVERGIRDVSLRNIEKLAVALRISAAELMRETVRDVT